MVPQSKVALDLFELNTLVEDYLPDPALCLGLHPRREVVRVSDGRSSDRRVRRRDLRQFRPFKRHPRKEGMEAG